MRVSIVARGSHNKLTPIHPGEVLADAIQEAGLTVNSVALGLCVPANRIGAIVKGQRSISVDTAMRLARYFGTTPELWLNLQVRYDLERARDTLADRIEREVAPRQAA